MPLLRYRTGDIASVTGEPCRCGRTTARIRGLRGRRDDMVIVRGVNVYPSNVEHALLSVPDAAPHYQLVVERSGAMDELTVQCEPVGSEVDSAGLRTDAERVLREHLGIRVRSTCSSPERCRGARARPCASSTVASGSAGRRRCSRRAPAGRRGGSPRRPARAAIIAWSGPPTAREPLADPQAEALEQLGNRLRMHLEAVALVQLRELLGVGLDRRRPGRRARGRSARSRPAR